MVTFLSALPLERQEATRRRVRHVNNIRKSKGQQKPHTSLAAVNCGRKSAWKNVLPTIKSSGHSEGYSKMICGDIDAAGSWISVSSLPNQNFESKADASRLIP